MQHGTLEERVADLQQDGSISPQVSSDTDTQQLASVPSSSSIRPADGAVVQPRSGGTALKRTNAEPRAAERRAKACTQLSEQPASAIQGSSAAEPAPAQRSSQHGAPSSRAEAVQAAAAGRQTASTPVPVAVAISVCLARGLAALQDGSSQLCLRRVVLA